MLSLDFAINDMSAKASFPPTPAYGNYAQTKLFSLGRKKSNIDDAKSTIHHPLEALPTSLITLCMKSIFMIAIEEFKDARVSMES